MAKQELSEWARKRMEAVRRGESTHLNLFGERLLETVTDMKMLKAGDSFKPIVEQHEKLIAG